MQRSCGLKITIWFRDGREPQSYETCNSNDWIDSSYDNSWYRVSRGNKNRSGTTADVYPIDLIQVIHEEHEADD